MKNTSIIIFLTLVLTSVHALAESSLTSSNKIKVTQSIGTNKTSSADSTVNITTISPGFKTNYNKRKLSVVADYSLIASTDNTNNESNVSHELTLQSQFAHNPKNWSSHYSINIFQKNTSDTQQLVKDNTTSAFSNSYITQSLGSTRKFKVSRNADLNSSITLSSQGFENETSTKNAIIALQFDVQELLPFISLTTAIKSNKNLNTNNSNHSLSLTSYYLINYQLKTFLSAIQYTGTSSNNALDKTRLTLGFNWDITPKSYLKFDIGTFDKESSWSTDITHTLRRTSFKLKHTESVAPANQTLLDNLNENTSTFSSATGNDLKFIKNSSLSISHFSRRLTSSLTLSKSQQSNSISSSSDRSNFNSTLSLNYKLNKNKSIAYSFSKIKIITSENNQLSEHSVNWSSKLTRKSSYNVTYRHSKQDSDQPTFDSQLNQINFNYNYEF